MTAVEEGDGPRPVLRVIRGDATPEEVAAVLAVVLAAASAAADGPTQAQPTSVWSTRAALRSGRAAAPLDAGSDGWRTSFWDR